MKRKGLVNIKAIAAGFVADFAASTIFSILLSLLAVVILAGKGYSGDDLEKMLLSVINDAPYRIFSLVAGLGFTLVGGYIAGRLAGVGELFHAGAVGILNILFGLFFLDLHYSWLQALAFVLVLPAALIGGNIAKQRRLGSADGSHSDSTF